MKFVDEDGEIYHQLHEVYYGKEGRPNGYTENAVSVFSTEGINGLNMVLKKMQGALKKPVLEEADFAKSLHSSEVAPVGENVILGLGFSVAETAGSREANAVKLSTAGLKAFFNICRDWQLTSDQEIILLGNPSSASHDEWKRSPETFCLDQDTLVRISYLLGIYKSLQIVLPSQNSADAWIRTSNDAPLFSGKSALDLMLSGKVSDLFAVRQYLDSVQN
jgi:hypothetical protein